MLLNRIGEEEFLQAIQPDYEFKDISETHANDIRLHNDTQPNQPPKKRRKKYKGGRRTRKRKARKRKSHKTNPWFPLS